MMYYDVHTHSLCEEQDDIFEIYCCDLFADAKVYRRCSVGVHPWKSTDPACADVWKKVVEHAANENVLAIGESGLDSVHRPKIDLSLQEKLFRDHIALSEAVKKPLIVHCLHQTDRLLALRRETHAVQPWIFHRFTGGFEEARRLNGNGILISMAPDFIFNKQYRESSITAFFVGERERAPLIHFFESTRFLIETDDQDVDIRGVYELFARAVQCPLEVVSDRVHDNLKGVFL